MEEKLRKENDKMRKQINYVEGYHPEAELMPVESRGIDGTVTIRSYLPLVKKEEWFYLKYPFGVMRNRIEESTETFVKASSALYADRFDPDEAYIRKEYVTMGIRYDDAFFAGKSKEEIIGITENRAKAKAESNALFKAGFGLQLEEDEESDAADRLVIEELLKKQTLPVPEKIPAPVFSETGGETQKLIEAGQVIDYLPEPEKVKQETVKVTVTKENGSGQQMSFEQAKAVISRRGDTVGELMTKNPSYIIWGANNSPDEMEKRACKVLVDTDQRLAGIAKRQARI